MVDTALVSERESFILRTPQVQCLRGRAREVSRVVLTGGRGTGTTEHKPMSPPETGPRRLQGAERPVRYLARRT